MKAEAKSGERFMFRCLRRLSFVPRWGVVPTIRKQTVAEHSFGVASNVLWLAARNMLHNEPEWLGGCLREALEHDHWEAVTGDHPSPTKKRCDPREMGQRDITVKVADILEALQFLREEKAMGNTFGHDVIRMDLVARLHDYWQCFQWVGLATDPVVSKPITSDLARIFEDFAVSGKQEQAHPLLEAYPVEERQ